MQALRLANSLGKVTARLLLVAHEPSELGGIDGRMGLSDSAERAVAAAMFYSMLLGLKRYIRLESM